jgi:putative tryptophan/tyrosine transport system substrate-binding protein
VRRALFVASVLASAVLVGCSGDDEPEMTIGFLRAVGVAQESQDALLDEMAGEGWVEGENLTVLGGSADVAHEDPEDAAAAAREMVDDGADLLITLASTSAIAARDADLGVPILFLVNDPMAAGLVTDERAPDGNLTGLSFRVPPDRTLDVLTSLGGIERVGVLAPRDDPAADGYRADFMDAADQLGLEAIDAEFTSEEDAGDAVRAAAEAGADAIAIVSAPATVRAFPAIEAAALEAGLPVIANTKVAEFALIVLSPDSDAVYRQLGRQAARILDGTEVSDVPVEDPASFVLTLRAAAADQLGIELPDELVARADEVES